jgi:hypothetical protein
MAMKFKNNFKGEMQRLANTLGKDAPRIIYKAEAITLKKLGISIRAEVTKIARKKLGLQKEPAGTKISADQFKKEFTRIEMHIPSKGKAHMAVIVKGKSVPMARFLSSPKKILSQKGIKPRRRKKVVVEVFKGKKKTLASTTSKTPFLFRDENGKIQVGKRHSTGVRKRRKDGQWTDVYVRNLTGASVATFLRTLGIKKEIETKMKVRFQNQFIKRFRFFAQAEIKRRLKAGLVSTFK